MTDGVGVGRDREELNRLSGQVIGAAIEVHRCLGPGFLENVYEEAMAVELALRGIGYERQVPVSVIYRGHQVGKGRMDMVVAGAVVVELKHVDALLDLHFAQLLSYLKATGLELGLLINFNVSALRLGIRRAVLG